MFDAAFCRCTNNDVRLLDDLVVSAGDKAPFRFGANDRVTICAAALNEWLKPGPSAGLLL
jgi:hypothetical protein